jgi:hypothetical protein
MRHHRDVCRLAVAKVGSNESLLPFNILLRKSDVLQCSFTSLSFKVVCFITAIECTKLCIYNYNLVASTMKVLSL